MPIALTAYSCAYKCGRKVLTSRKQMEAHEARCFHNPSTKACQSCAHFKIDYETFYNPYHGGNPGSTDYDIKVPYCDVREDVNLQESLQNNCPQHQSK